MSDVTTQLLIKLGGVDSDALQLEADSRDGALNRPLEVNYTDPASLFWQALWSTFSDPPTKPEPWERLLEVKAPGQAYLRLYCRPKAKVQLHLSEPAPFIAAVPEFFRAERGRRVSAFDVSAPAYVIQIPGKDAKQYPPFEDLGSREASEFEVLEFNFQREARLKRPHASGVELLYGSLFINRNGEAADMPQPQPHDPTLFQTGEEVSGCLVVRYNSHYKLLRCHYGLPTGALLDELRWAWIKGDITQVQMPPLMAFALSDQRAALAQIERKVWPPGIVWSYFNHQSKEEDSEKVLSETGRVTSTEKVSSKNDPDTYVEVERAREITLQDQQGRLWKMRLAGKA